MLSPETLFFFSLFPLNCLNCLDIPIGRFRAHWESSAITGDHLALLSRFQPLLPTPWVPKSLAGPTGYSAPIQHSHTQRLGTTNSWVPPNACMGPLPTWYPSPYVRHLHSLVKFFNLYRCVFYSFSLVIPAWNFLLNYIYISMGINLNSLGKNINTLRPLHNYRPLQLPHAGTYALISSHWHTELWALSPMAAFPDPRT